MPSLPYELLRQRLASTPKVWVITGVAGFIGSNLLEDLLGLGQHVVGVDNFSTGHRSNVDDVLSKSSGGAARFRMIEGDIRNLETCREACEGADYVLHHAALGSVPWSIDDPLKTNAVNVDGFVNMLVAAKDAGVKRFVYASSSAVYGDTAVNPQVEESLGRPLSPYGCISNDLRFADRRVTLLQRFRTTSRSCGCVRRGDPSMDCESTERRALPHFR